DIDLVMTQAGVSKSKAVKSLTTHIEDIFAAIMELPIQGAIAGVAQPEEEVDETGVDPHDIDLVMTQA
ncbi:nascent polypeptide-associated complex subunit alpha-like protein 2-like, partial [Trifolium medium]|nr:nascent polypeptide-associated complex subunit alpha-like protein 2-like [Trifolium medium]